MTMLYGQLLAHYFACNMKLPKSGVNLPYSLNDPITWKKHELYKLRIHAKQIIILL